MAEVDKKYFRKELYTNIKDALEEIGRLVEKNRQADGNLVFDNLLKSKLEEQSKILKQNMDMIISVFEEIKEGTKERLKIKKERETELDKYEEQLNQKIDVTLKLFDKKYKAVEEIMSLYQHLNQLRIIVGKVKTFYLKRLREIKYKKKDVFIIEKNKLKINPSTKNDFIKQLQDQINSNQKLKEKIKNLKTMGYENIPDFLVRPREAIREKEIKEALKMLTYTKKLIKLIKEIDLINNELIKNLNQYLNFSEDEIKKLDEIFKKLLKENKITRKTKLAIDEDSIKKIIEAEETEIKYEETYIFTHIRSFLTSLNNQKKLLESSPQDEEAKKISERKNFKSILEYIEKEIDKIIKEIEEYSKDKNPLKIAELLEIIIKGINNIEEAFRYVHNHIKYIKDSADYDKNLFEKIKKDEKIRTHLIENIKKETEKTLES